MGGGLISLCVLRGTFYEITYTKQRLTLILESNLIADHVTEIGGTRTQFLGSLF